MTIHPDKVRVATGQVGKSPQILIWSSKTLQTVSIMKGVHTDGVGILAFDKTGNVIFFRFIWLFKRCMFMNNNYLLIMIKSETGFMWNRSRLDHSRLGLAKRKSVGQIDWPSGKSNVEVVFKTIHYCYSFINTEKLSTILKGF